MHRDGSNLAFWILAIVLIWGAAFQFAADENLQSGLLASVGLSVALLASRRGSEDGIKR